LESMTVEAMFCCGSQGEAKLRNVCSVPNTIWDGGARQLGTVEKNKFRKHARCFDSCCCEHRGRLIYQNPANKVDFPFFMFHIQHPENLCCKYGLDKSKLIKDLKMSARMRDGN